MSREPFAVSKKLIAHSSLLIAVFALIAHSPQPTAVFSEEISAYSKALAAYQDRRLEEAFRYAKQAAYENPDHPDAYALLGELYYLRQELTKAQESWEKALRMAPSRQDVRDRLTKLQSELRVERDLTRSDTYPFVVRFAEGEIPGELGDVRLALRDTYRLVGQAFGYFPDHPITVILYPEADFPKVKGMNHQVAGLYDGKIRLPLTKGNSRSRELQAILWHEYTHALVHDLSKGRCPVWLNEGIATLQEARVRAPPALASDLKVLRRQGFVPWEKFWQMQYEAADLSLHYTQGFLITQYLVKYWGRGKVVVLLKRLGQGTPIGDAFRAEYKKDPKGMEKEWLTWAQRGF